MGPKTFPKRKSIAEGPRMNYFRYLLDLKSSILISKILKLQNTCTLQGYGVNTYYWADVGFPVVLVDEPNINYVHEANFPKHFSKTQPNAI